MNGAADAAAATVAAACREASHGAATAASRQPTRQCSTLLPQQQHPQPSAAQPVLLINKPPQQAPHQQCQQQNTILCARSLVGRIIGKNGVTVQGIQLFANAVIGIDQSTDPSVVLVIGPPVAVALATNILLDVIAGTFKGFALLREIVHAKDNGAGAGGWDGPSRPIYVPGQGLIPMRQANTIIMAPPSASSSLSSASMAPVLATVVSSVSTTVAANHDGASTRSLSDRISLALQVALLQQQVQYAQHAPQQHVLTQVPHEQQHHQLQQEPQAHQPLPTSHWPTRTRSLQNVRQAGAAIQQQSISSQPAPTPIWQHPMHPRQLSSVVAQPFANRSSVFALNP